MSGDELAGWAALYAAIVATLALGLELRRWFESGVKLIIHYSTDSTPYLRSGRQPQVDVSVSNRGDMPTTLTHLGVEVHSGWLWRVLGRPDETWVINNPNRADNLPKKLAPGEMWVGAFPKDERVEALLEKGSLTLVVLGVHANKPQRMRLRPTRPLKPSGKSPD